MICMKRFIFSSYNKGAPFQPRPLCLCVCVCLYAPLGEITQSRKIERENTDVAMHGHISTQTRAYRRRATQDKVFRASFRV